MLKNVSLTLPQNYQHRATIGKILVHLLLLAFSIVALIPFVMLLAGSFSSENAIATKGYSLLPQDASFQAYQFILADPAQIFNSYFITITVTLGGGSGGLLVMSLLAYALSRKDFALHKLLAFYVFFTMLFNGGLVPWYILITQYLHLKDNILALILPTMVVPWFVLLLRTYFSGLPSELIEAAKIDGAGEWRIFFKVVVPLSTPALATVGLFLVLNYWNDWWLALLFIDDKKLVPLQYLLYTIQSNIDALSTDPNLVSGGPIPAITVRLAMAVLAIGPIIFAFLFAQKYFVRGVTLGGVKE
ncbi:MAG: carbohydrate ABC transporter permease [Chloroflexi bacterium]|nr:carbohydrate ABC transporter permease [Chloroflexota bacterium]OJV88326.1 MAG: sugar ABC transporter permease [Chloroflexi bacterium 54-19]